ncbi:DUF5949 family protein [Streptomyces massasporeus]
MTSISPETQSVSTNDLGSLVVQSWQGTTPEGNDVPYLPACSLGDGAKRSGGHCEGHRAVRHACVAGGRRAR